jgi:CspA family cold shock protein
MPTGEEQRIKCVDCGQEFLFTAGEQAFYREHNLTHAPTRCKQCRMNRKGARGPRTDTERTDAVRSHAPRPASALPEGGGAGRVQGVVKWFNQAKGFGFIRDDAGTELFVHFSAIQSDGLKTLRQGERVEFHVVPGARGNQAANVTRIG